MVQGAWVAAGAIIFDKGIDNKRFPVEKFTVIQRFSFEIGTPKIASILRVEKMVQQKIVTLLCCRQIISVGIAKTGEVRMRKSPDHPALGNDLLFGRSFTAGDFVIAEQVTTPTGILRCI